MNTGKVDVYVGVHKGLRNLVSRLLIQVGETDWARLQTAVGL
jgi:hypothetical protein